MGESVSTGCPCTTEAKDKDTLVFSRLLLFQGSLLWANWPSVTLPRAYIYWLPPLPPTSHTRCLDVWRLGCIDLRWISSDCIDSHWIMSIPIKQLVDFHEDFMTCNRISSIFYVFLRFQMDLRGFHWYESLQHRFSVDFIDFRCI